MGSNSVANLLTEIRSMLW